MFCWHLAGVTSNADAAQLAETFAEAKCPTKVFIYLFVIFYGKLWDVQFLFVRHELFSVNQSHSLKLANQTCGAYFAILFLIQI